MSKLAERIIAFDKRLLHDMLLLKYDAMRSGGIQGSATISDLMAFGVNESWQKPLLDYAYKYSRQVKINYKQFVKDHKKGVFAWK